MSLRITKDDVGKSFVTRSRRVKTMQKFDDDPNTDYRVLVDGEWYAENGQFMLGQERSEDLIERFITPAAELFAKCTTPTGPQNVLRTLPADANERKAAPIVSGVLDYFPLAIAEIARISKAGNDQHNPGQPLHWARHKSTDHADCVGRHLLERGTIDTDGQRHTAKAAWRILALLQEELEAEAGWKPAPEIVDKIPDAKEPFLRTPLESKKPSPAAIDDAIVEITEAEPA